MTYRLFTLLAAGMFALGLIASNVCLTYAQGQSSAPAPYKIGIVDVQKVMDNYNKRAVEVQKLEGEVSKKKDEIEKLRATFEAELKQFQEDRTEMTPDERADREAELDSRALAVDSAIRQAEASLERQRRRLKAALITDIVDAVNKIGDQENYHLILEADPEKRTGVLYHTSTIDMTSKVIDRLNSGR